MDERSDKERTDLETHVLLCAQRYNQLRLAIYIVAGLEIARTLGIDGLNILKVLVH